MGLYLLELLEGRKLNQVDVQEITKKTNTLVNEVSVSRLKEASTILQNTGCTHTEAIAPMIETLTSQFAPDLFHHLRNTYQQQKFFEDKFNLINPKVIILPESEEYFGRVQTGKPQAQKEQSYIAFGRVLTINKKPGDIYQLKRGLPILGISPDEQVTNRYSV